MKNAKRRKKKKKMGNSDISSHCYFIIVITHCSAIVSPYRYKKWEKIAKEKLNKEVLK